MENSEEMQEQMEQQEHYVPRPWWQVWGARIGLVLFLVFVFYQWLRVYRGGF